LIESALLHHLNAFQQIPVDLIIPPELVVMGESTQLIMEMIEHPPEPTEAMKALFHNEMPVEMVINDDSNSST
jgi:uncharacterized protein (DUF1778 family)